MDSTRTELHISVRNLVEFIFREGDIDNRQGRMQSPDAMLEGSRIHRKIQGEQDETYMAEVPLKYTITGEQYDLTVEGRADGIFPDADGHMWIDEIKGVYRRLEYLEEPVYVHKAQAMCYAYIFAVQNELSSMGVQMTYCNLDTQEKKQFRERFTMEELQEWFLRLMESYRRWADFSVEWKRLRQESIHQLVFPYEYREGQKALITDVYRTIARNKILFLQAPTGVGKTISTIFPAVKAVGEGMGDRIFYLTAKTITATVAKETFSLLMERGYRAKMIQLTAKEKLCMCEEMDCNPQHCPYAKGHYDRVNDAVYDILQNRDKIEREDILAQAEKFQVCPFELSLDIASWSDDIVCDYNYVFDPTAYLKRFFGDGVKGDYLFLVDEAHNLVERSRSMYSAILYKEEFLEAKKLLKPYSKRLQTLLDKCNKTMLAWKRQVPENGYQIHEEIGVFYYQLLRTAGELEELLQKPVELAGRREILDFYYHLRSFLNIYDWTDEHYVIYSEIAEDGRFGLKLFCVDPSENLQRCLDKARATIFFSATFLPINYYKSLLSTNEDNYAIYAQPVFSQRQRLLAFGRDVSTKYTLRNRQQFLRIAQYIRNTVKVKQGNYMVFFPSYKLMEQVYEAFMELEDKSGDCADEVYCLIQKNGMKEQEREAFLQEFDVCGRTLVAFCVMGGIFGEGVDLKEDRLIGAIVVGTGLPQVSNERTILKEYYDVHEQNGFDYAYRYPGINKVLQAAGRVIRTTEDRGVILLLDERFLQREYENLYPREWSRRQICTVDTIGRMAQKFWEDDSYDKS